MSSRHILLFFVILEKIHDAVVTTELGRRDLPTDGTFQHDVKGLNLD